MWKESPVASFSERVARAVRVLQGKPLREASATLVVDPDLALTYSQGGSPYFRPLTDTPKRDLPPLDQQRMAEVAVHLYQSNPIAKRLILRVVNYLLGEGVTVSSEDEKAQEILSEWWKHDGWDRRMHDDVTSQRVYGELLLPVTVNDVDGTVRTGFISPTRIEKVDHEPNDIRARTCVILKSSAGEPAKRFKIIREDTDPDSDTFGELVGLSDEEAAELKEYEDAVKAAKEKKGAITPKVKWPTYFGACHYATINTLPDMTRGISDLWPIGDYVDAYETLMWDLMERAGIVNSFVGWMQHTGADPDDLDALAKRYGENLPKAASLIHTNEKTVFQLLTPSFAGADADTFADLMLGIIATGGGVPDYWLNAQLDPNRASAEAMAVPIIKDLSEQQRELKTLVEDMARFVLVSAQRHKSLTKSKDEIDISVDIPPLAEADAKAGAAVVQAAAQGILGLRDGKLLDKDTAIRVVAAVVGLVGVDVTAEDIMDALEKEEAEEAKQAEEDAKKMPPIPEFPTGEPAGNGAAPPTGGLPMAPGNGSKPAATPKPPVPPGASGKAPSSPPKEG